MIVEELINELEKLIRQGSIRTTAEVRVDFRHELEGGFYTKPWRIAYDSSGFNTLVIEVGEGIR